MGPILRGPGAVRSASRRKCVGRVTQAVTLHTLWLSTSTGHVHQCPDIQEQNQQKETRQSEVREGQVVAIIGFQLTLLHLRSWFFRSFISKHYASVRLGWCFLSHLAQSFCIYISCQTVLTSYTESISHDRQTPGLYRIRLASIEPAVLAIRQELFTRRSTDLYCVYRFYRLYSMQSQLIIVQATSLRIKLAQNQKPSPRCSGEFNPPSVRQSAVQAQM